MAIKYNMEFYTHITIPKTPFTFSYTVQTVLLGSCFAENIGKKLEGNKFKTDLNPFGTLYNPSSIAEAIRMLLQPEQFTGDDLFQHEGIYHSFSHHSRFSSPSETECLANINRRLFSSADTILKAQRMILTFGTAWVYKLKSSGKVVSNCHRLPEKMFDRQLLTVGEIVAEWKSLLLSLWKQNPELKILFTVSPIRHWKDGAHGNQLSKATPASHRRSAKGIPGTHRLFPCLRNHDGRIEGVPFLCRRYAASIHHGDRIYLGTVHRQHAFT